MSSKNPIEEIKLLSSLATMAAIQGLTSEIEHAAKIRLTSDFGPTVALIARIQEGEPADLAILTTAAVDALVDKKILSSRAGLAVSLVGMAVRAGAPKPNIDSVDNLKATLLRARSIVYSKIGASGIFFADLLRRLGIAKEIESRTIVVPSGFTATLVASGEAELAIQQISELMAVPGIDIVGPLPPGAESVTPFCIGIFASSAHRTLAHDVVRLLTSRRAAQAYQKSGLQPITAKGPL